MMLICPRQLAVAIEDSWSRRRSSLFGAKRRCPRLPGMGIFSAASPKRAANSRTAGGTALNSSLVLLSQPCMCRAKQQSVRTLWFQHFTALWIFGERNRRLNLRVVGKNLPVLLRNLIAHSSQSSSKKCLKIVTYCLIFGHCGGDCFLREWALIAQIHQGGKHIFC
jgi:hypothetical protein